MGESIDIVMVANNFRIDLWTMTKNALRSATENAGMKVGEVLTIEQNRKARPQSIGRTIYYDFPFNYNKCLNLGKSICTSQYIAFCNNDLYFEKGWAKNAVQAMKEGGYLSASPSGRHVFKGVIEGYDVGKQILGWCIIADKRLFDIIGDFSEVVYFWYSDDVYAVQLRCAGIKHILVGNSKVRHFVSKTHHKIKDEKGGRADRTTGQHKLFLNYKNKMYADSGIEIKVKGGHNNRRKHKV